MLLHDDLNWYKSRHRLQNAQQPPTPGGSDSAVPSVSNHEFDIVSFNLLAPVYKRLTSKNTVTGHRHREAGDYSLWSERLVQTMDFFRTEIYRDAAIIALQEYWLDARYRRIFEEQFQQHGYECRVMQRSGTKADAVALVIKSEIFEIRATENINLCTFGDRVALLLWLRHRSTGFDLLVANTHLSFPHNVLDRMNQVAQMKHLTGEIQQFAHTHGVENAPALIMGDFNVEAHSPVCDHLRSTGYYSCFEICPPVNTHDHHHHRNHDDVMTTTTTTTFTTHETCVLPTAADQQGDLSSKRDVFECDDVGDNCLELAPEDRPPSSHAPAEASNHQQNQRTPHNDHQNGAHHPTKAQVQRQDQATTTTVSRLIRSTVSYVSHFNHRNEEVGVDHIFLKPLPSGDPADESHAWEVVRPTNASSTTHASSEAGAEAASNAVPQIFVAECQVLPKSVTCSAWYPQFQISDHRPVRAKMIFTHVEK